MTNKHSSSFTEKSPAVFVTDAQPVTVGLSDLESLKRSAAASPKRRARICAHRSSDDAIHEMLIVLQGDTYVRPHRHHGKCESMHAIEGRAALIYFTEKGEPQAIRFLGASSNTDCLFCRTEQAIYHTVVVLTESFVFHETVQGPLRPSDTEYASWAPAEEDAAAVAAYRKILSGIVEEGLRPESAWRTANL
jgi:cupin fold WbuC family metalloprotein